MRAERESPSQLHMLRSQFPPQSECLAALSADQTLSERRPFHPFTIELSGGQRFEVDHPHVLADHDGLAFFLAPRRIFYLCDH